MSDSKNLFENLDNYDENMKSHYFYANGGNNNDDDTNNGLSGWK